MTYYNVIITIVSATNLDSEITGLMEASVQFKTKMTEMQKTRTYEKSINPFWCEEFECLIEEDEEIIFEIKNNKSIKRDLPQAILIFPRMKEGEVKREKLEVSNSGVLTVKLTCKSVESNKKENEE